MRPISVSLFGLRHRRQEIFLALALPQNAIFCQGRSISGNYDLSRNQERVSKDLSPPIRLSSLLLPVSQVSLFFFSGRQNYPTPAASLRSIITMQVLKNYINGVFVASAATTQTTTIINPSTGRAYATAPQSNVDDVNAAMKAAATAFETWKDTTPGERQLALIKIADLIEKHAAELIDIECQNTGKPKHLTESEEIPPMVDQIRFFAGAARNLEGKSAGQYMKGLWSMIVREPVGVCAQVTPWNYVSMVTKPC